MEERIDRLEEALASFIEESRRFRREDRESMREWRERNARTDEQLLRMQQQAEKDRRQADKDRQRADKDRRQADKDRRQADKDRQQADKDRQQAEKDRQQAEISRERDRQEAEKERRDFNRRMAELSDSMGTLVEDMVVPNADRIAAQIFGDDPVLDISQRVRRRRGGESMELDLLAAGSRNVMVVESKRRLRPEDSDSFLLKLQRLPEFFPEYAGYRIVPVIASVTIDPSMVLNLTRRKVYGLAFGDETMELVNLGQF